MFALNITVTVYNINVRMTFNFFYQIQKIEIQEDRQR